MFNDKVKLASRSLVFLTLLTFRERTTSLYLELLNNKMRYAKMCGSYLTTYRGSGRDFCLLGLYFVTMLMTDVRREFSYVGLSHSQQHKAAG